ncbi:YusG family protein [Falsibacillus albus]|uniref:DUF2553 family protein n=1 Tax=Falsibacillus albus TaxID=2478915 RepID=A0A3L7K2J3_9BACI|nr:YusG family protein [Falsibacillus albus]RLQ96559.1 DUF2553 family protein [Falsibacillus albus]
MALNPKKMDVTERVVGKLKHNQIELYLDGQSIGTMSLPEGIELNLAMEPNFEAIENKIYQHYTATEGDQARYTDCDEGGWC